MTPANTTVVATVMSTLLCPEAPLTSNTMPSAQIQFFNGTFYPAGPIFAKCNYAANWGGSLNSLGSDYTTTESKTSQGAYLGVMMTVKATTTLGSTTCIRAQDIRDGMANTLMVGEKRDSQGWDVGGYGGSEFDVGPSPYFPIGYLSLRRPTPRPLLADGLPWIVPCLHDLFRLL